MREAVKQSSMADMIRRHITRGDWRPGRRLATRRELETQFKLSRVTVQRALDQLAGDGFIESRGRQGTFVAQRPPHLSHYGLVLPHRSLRGDAWTSFAEALATEARALAGGGERVDLSIFYDSKSRSDPDRDYAQLLSSVCNHRLAGLIFTYHPASLIGTPVLDEPGIPRVAIMAARGHFPGVVSVSPDFTAWCEAGLDYLHQRGCRRPALLSLWHGDAVAQSFRRTTAQRGTITGPHTELAASDPEAAYNLTHVLMRVRDADRPDALLISDDHLVGPSVRALLELGVRVGQDLQVIAHCNWGYQPPCPAPVTWLGFSPRQMVERCIEIIHRERRTGERGNDVLVAPVFHSPTLVPSEPESEERI